MVKGEELIQIEIDCGKVAELSGWEKAFKYF